MHLVLLSTGQGNELSVQHIHHHHGSAAVTPSRYVDLLVLDARHMSQSCIETAMKSVAEIRTRNGFRHGVLLCEKPALPLVVAAIRTGLRDVISQFISAAHLRQLLRSALPTLTRREYRGIVAFLRAFNSFSAVDGDSLPLARRAEELDRRNEDLTEQFKILNAEKDRLSRLEQDIRERTRRLDRQIARLQNDSDVSVSSATVSADQAAMAKRLDQRSAELDVREKLLNEMQTLLLSAPQSAPMAKHLPLGPGPTAASARAHIGAPA